MSWAEPIVDRVYYTFYSHPIRQAAQQGLLVVQGKVPDGRYHRYGIVTTHIAQPGISENLP
jgi:hypothetical protein